MKNTTLGISWLNGRLTAQVYGRGRSVAQWDSGLAVFSLENVADGVRQAIEETGFKGREVMMVVASPRLTSQRVEAPPVKGNTFRRLLKRKVQHLSPFKEEAVWGYVESNIRNQSRGAIVQMLPETVFESLLAACERHGLILTRLFTPVDALTEQLGERAETKKAPALLAAEAGGAVNLVAGDANGKVVFARSFQGRLGGDAGGSPAVTSSAERIAQELQRSLSYCETQLDQKIEEIVWLGNPDTAAAIGSRVQVPVTPWVFDSLGATWIEETSVIPATSSQNLVPVEVQARRKSQTLVRWTAAAVGLFFLGALGCLFTVEKSLRKEMELEAAATNERIVALQRQADLQVELDALQLRKERMDAFVVQDRELLWHWTPAYVATVVHPDWALTLVKTEPKEDGLLVSMEGVSSKRSRIPSTMLSVFRERLHDDVFEISESLVGEATVEVATPQGERRSVSGFRARVEATGINTSLKLTNNQ